MSLDLSLRELVKTQCSHCGETNSYEGSYVWSRNITHNLNKMAQKAGIYKELWRPEETDARCAADLLPALKNGLKKLKAKPSYYKKFDSENGWGIYEHFVPFVEEVIEAYEKYPDLMPEADR